MSGGVWCVPRKIETINQTRRCRQTVALDTKDIFNKKSPKNAFACSIDVTLKAKQSNFGLILLVGFKQSVKEMMGEVVNNIVFTRHLNIIIVAHFYPSLTSCKQYKSLI